MVKAKYQRQRKNDTNSLYCLFPVQEYAGQKVIESKNKQKIVLDDSNPPDSYTITAAYNRYFQIPFI